MWFWVVGDFFGLFSNLIHRVVERKTGGVNLR